MDENIVSETLHTNTSVYRIRLFVAQWRQQYLERGEEPLRCRSLEIPKGVCKLWKCHVNYQGEDVNKRRMGEDLVS